MRKTILFLLISIFFQAAIAQELMTIGEVFDFEIGDEFQSRSSVSYQPPNADRVTITGKYYSVGLDTVFYIQNHDIYYAEMSWEGEPHLIYHYGFHTNTVFYTKLDSSILVYDQGFTLNQYIENSSELCDSLINGCAYSSGPGFENDYIINEYGKGLGMTYQYFYSGMGGYATIENTLFYYKKGMLICGVPDMTGVGVADISEKKSEFLVYPNPAGPVLYLQNNLIPSEFQYSIANAMGMRIQSGRLAGRINSLSTGHLAHGMYFLLVYSENKPTILKFIKE